MFWILEPERMAGVSAEERQARVFPLFRLQMRSGGTVTCVVEGETRRRGKRNKKRNIQLANEAIRMGSTCDESWCRQFSEFSLSALSLIYHVLCVLVPLLLLLIL
jgi:hypothetical protein